MSHVEFQKEFAISHGISPQAVAGALKSTYYSMDDAAHATFVIEIGAHTTDAVIEIHQAKNAAELDPALIAGKTLTIVVGYANSVKIIEVDGSEMTDGFSHLGIVTSCGGGGGALVSVTMIRSGLRYNPPEYV